MKLQAYLDRIKFEGRARPDADTLKRLHRGHVENIPYENLDVQFKREVSRDPAAIFDKLVTRRRGGWCYEMNGLFSWALDEVGFRHTRMAGGVVRALRGKLMLPPSGAQFAPLKGSALLLKHDASGFLRQVSRRACDRACGRYRTRLEAA